jgi:translation initiation factor 2 alpha subunit (eIF-2alpha)
MITQEAMHKDGAFINASKIKESAEKLGADVKDVGVQVWDQAKEELGDVKCAVQDAITSGKKVVKGNLGDYQEMIPNIKTYISQNPIKSLLIGVGTAFIASRALRS